MNFALLYFALYRGQTSYELGASLVNKYRSFFYKESFIIWLTITKASPNGTHKDRDDQVVSHSAPGWFYSGMPITVDLVDSLLEALVQL